MRRGEREAGIVLGRFEIFGIGLVDHQQNVARQAGMKPGELGRGQVAAGGVVGVGDEHHPRALGHRGEQRVDVGAVVAVGGFDRDRPAAPRGDVVDDKGKAREQHLVAHSGVAQGDKVEQLVRAGPADDPRRVDLVELADRLAQRGAVAVRIAVRSGRLGARGERRRAGPERVLVGRELGEHPPVRARAPAGNIGVDRFDPRFGSWSAGHCGAAHSSLRHD